MIPDWALETAAALVAVPTGCSALELIPSGFTDILPPGILHDVQPDAAATWFVSDALAHYGLVLVAVTQNEPVTVQQVPCLELTQAYTVPKAWGLVEWGARCCVKGGILIAFVADSTGLPETVASWLHSKGVLIAELTDGQDLLLVYRHGVCLKDFKIIDDFVAVEAMLQEGKQIRVPVATDDPRPLRLKSWNISLATNTGTYTNQDATQLYLSKNRVGVKWSCPNAAFEWAMHQALTAPLSESWNKTVERFNERFLLEAYLLHRQDNLNSVLNLPASYQVVEEKPLQRYLNKLDRRIQRLLMPYPEKTTLENRYYTLGPGSRLRQGEQIWNVTLSEPDFAHRNPPKVYLEEAPIVFPALLPKSSL